MDRRVPTSNPFVTSQRSLDSIAAAAYQSAYQSNGSMTAIPRHAAITADLRRKILGGQCAPGTTLPTIRMLATEYDTSYFTAQTALTPLVEEGLIRRRRRTGTVVCADIGVLTRTAIYCSSAFIDEPQYAFTRELCRQLQQQSAAHRVATRLFTDLRPVADQSAPLPELVRAIKTDRIQALFVPLCDATSRRWLRQLGLPISFVSGSTRHGVGFSTRQMIRLALERLRTTGCRTVGLVSPDLGTPGREGRDQPIRALFTETAAALGLGTEDAWVRVRRVDGHGHERFGYEAFTALWAQASPPAGLLVYPDTVARGVTMAILEQGVGVPDDLRLVFHRNAGIDWPCPPAVDWVVSDVARWAAEMIDMVQRQHQGETTAPVVLDYQLVENQSANKMTSCQP